jgi:alpha-mannosidase
VSGAIGRLLWTAGGNIELVNQDFPPGLNGYIYVPGRDPKASLGLTNVSIRPGEPGPLVASVIVEAKAPGARSLRTEVRVIDGLCRVEILNVLDKAAVRDKESVHFAFPLNVPEGTVRLDTGWALIRPRQDEIAGACRDFFGAQKSVDISNGNYGVTWTPVDAPLAEIGAITDETLRPGDGRAWRTEVPPGNVLYSYAMNNYWHTNYRADQEGPVTLRYTIEPHGTFDESAVKRLGLEAVNPLVSLPAGDGTAVPRLPFSVTGPEFVVTCCKPSADGLGWIVRAFNAGGRVARLNVAWTGPGGHGVWMSGLDEGKVRRLEGPLEVPGNGIVTLRLERL